MGSEWFRTWFDTDYYHLLYNQRDDNEARQFIDALLAFLDPTPEATFLDVACGRGRHSMQLAHKGFPTTGIDLSRNCISIANQIDSPLLEFHVQDIRVPFTCGPFDYALNLFTSFGYFETDLEHERAIFNVYNALKPNGTFVLDYMNTEYVSEHIAHTEVVTSGSVEFHINRSISDNQIVKKINVKTQDNNHEEYFERVRAFTPNQLIELIEKVGFSVMSIHGNYRFEALDASKPRVIIIAQKK